VHAASEVREHTEDERRQCGGSAGEGLEPWSIPKKEERHRLMEKIRKEEQIRWRKEKRGEKEREKKNGHCVSFGPKLIFPM
jgi:hypothetical protein